MGTAYTIFGAGPARLSAEVVGGWSPAARPWRATVVELIEWGDYAFDGPGSGSRHAGRADRDPLSATTIRPRSYVEAGGMRFTIEWDGTQGHQLVTLTINKLGLGPQGECRSGPPHFDLAALSGASGERCWIYQEELHGCPVERRLPPTRLATTQASPRLLQHA